MSRAFVVSQQKLAEKLTILKDRGIGMLTRIYNIKKGIYKFTILQFTHLDSPHIDN